MSDNKEHQYENSIISISQEKLELSVMGAYVNALEMGVDLDLIVLKMNERMPNLSKSVTQRRLKAWIGLGKEKHPMPAGYLAAYCFAVKSHKPIQVMANLMGKDILTAKQSEFNEVADILRTIVKLQKEVTEKMDVLEKKYGYLIQEKNTGKH